MGTPRFAEPAARWTAGACLFSGRPDPTWPLPDPIARGLEDLWDALVPLEGSPPVAPPLGYRGCFADDTVGGRQWKAYRGTVTLERADGREVRHDPLREFECCVLQSAPDGVLPENVLALAELEDRQ